MAKPIGWRPVGGSDWSISAAGSTGPAYLANPGPGSTATSLFNLGISALNVASILQLETKLSTNGLAGFIFDRYDADTFKFAAIDVVKDQLIIGHHTKKGWSTDAVVARDLTAGMLYTLGLTLKGSTVSLTLNGSAVLGFVYNAATVDGRFGLMANGGPASFDDVLMQTNDPAFIDRATPLSAPVSLAQPTDAAELDQSQLQPLIEEAISRLQLNESQQSILRHTPVRITDLPGDQFGAFQDGVVWIDTDAAGYGWFIDSTPTQDEDYQLIHGVLVARNGDAVGRVDLLSVLMHEFGHALGLEHTETGLMAENLAAGVRSTKIMEEDTDANVRGPYGALKPSSTEQTAVPSAMRQLPKDSMSQQATAASQGLSSINNGKSPFSRTMMADKPGVVAPGSPRGPANDLESNPHDWLLQQLRLLKRLPFRRKS